MEPEERLENEIKGAENAVRKMLMYYLSALEASGVEDTKQFVASRISEMIDLSDEQQKFIVMNFNEEGTIVHNINDCIGLLNKMKKDNKIDVESIDIIEQFLKLLLKDFEEFEYVD